MTEALHISPYLRLAPRSEAEARGMANPLQDIFRTSGDVVLTVERIKGASAVNAYIDAPGRPALLQAYEDAESPNDPSYPHPSFGGAIMLHENGTWTRVNIFKGDE